MSQSCQLALKENAKQKKQLQVTFLSWVALPERILQVQVAHMPHVRTLHATSLHDCIHRDEGTWHVLCRKGDE